MCDMNQNAAISLILNCDVWINTATRFICEEDMFTQPLALSPHSIKVAGSIP